MVDNGIVSLPLPALAFRVIVLPFLAAGPLARADLPSDDEVRRVLGDSGILFVGTDGVREPIRLRAPGAG